MEASAGAGAPAPKEPAQDGSTKQGLEVVGIALAAIGGGIGVLGFVAFFGAAILWIRLDAVGLPANEAVAVVPKSVLLTTGAGFLVPALLLALLFTALLFFFETGRVFLATREFASVKDLERERELDDAKRQAAKRAARAADEELARARTLDRIARAAEDADQVKEDVAEKFREGSNEAYANASKLSKAAAPVTSEGDTGEGKGVGAPVQEEARGQSPEQAREEADLLAREAEIAQKRADAEESAERFQGPFRIGAIILLFVGGAVFAFVEYSIHFRFGRFLLLILIMAVLSAVCVFVVSRFKFIWFSLAAFVSVAFLFGFVYYYKMVDDPRIEPAAVLRANGAPEFGVFVAQSSDRVYIGTTQPRGEWRMEAIVREEVTDMTIGPLKPKDKANEYGRRLAFEACEVARERRPEERVLAQASADPPAAGGESCTRRDLNRLQAEIEAEEGLDS